MNTNYIILSVAVIITIIVFIFTYSFFRENPWLIGFGDNNKTTLKYEGDGFIYVNIPDVISNLQGRGRRVCKASLDLKVKKTEAGLFYNEAFMNEMRDSIMNIMSDYNCDTLLTYEGKQRLKKHIKIKINDKLTSPAVSDVYISEFIIQ